MSAGLGFVGVSAVMFVVGAVSGELAPTLAGVAGVAAVGLGVFAMGALRVPTWARTRRQQMEGVAARLSLAAEGGRDGRGEGSQGNTDS
jgi:hypothetical protein